MTRLPINLLLYLAILGLLAGSGWQFYQAAVVEAKSEAESAKAQEANRDRFLEIFQRGADSAGKVAVGPNYAEPASFWDAFRDANFNGELPPPPPVEPGSGGEETTDAPPPQTPLEDLFVLTAVYDDGADSRVIIRYKPAANVEPPEDAVPPATGAGGFDTVASAPGRTPPTPQFPTYGDGLGFPQHLALEDTLWKPHSHIRLVRVARNHAVFVREDPTKPKEEWVEEPVYPEALDLPQDVLKKLAEGLGVERRPGDARPDDEGTGPVQQSGWQENEQTTEVTANRFNIGTRDRELFARDPERVFNEDVGTADWRSSRGSMRGVRITKLSPGYERFGVSEGDILVALNGEPVGSKAEAIRVGKRLYKRGVRTFEAEFLTSTGQTITRTYVAPDRD